MALEPVPCSHCGDDVQQRRPSRSGRHFCRKPECQRAKGRANYQSRVETAANIEKNHILQLVHALAHKPRKRCPECGLVNALPGYRHPDPNGGACAGMGAAKMGSLAMDLVLAIWPRGEREYAEVES